MFLFYIYLLVFKFFRNYQFKSDRTLNDDITLTLSENGINYASQRGSFNYTVEDFRKVIITNKIIAIYVSYRKAILIPKHFFTSKEEEHEIENFIKEKYRKKQASNEMRRKPEIWSKPKVDFFYNFMLAYAKE